MMTICLQHKWCCCLLLWGTHPVIVWPFCILRILQHYRCVSFSLALWILGKKHPIKRRKKVAYTVNGNLVRLRDKRASSSIRTQRKSYGPGWIGAALKGFLASLYEDWWFYCVRNHLQLFNATNFLQLLERQSCHVLLKRHRLLV